jgi:aryl-alcohol dehydrogenase-like predicted oxidoreductase
MKYNQLGPTNIRISEVSLGCMSLPTDENKATAIVHRAIDLGINYFDTADIYHDGVNETILGKALKSHRGKIILASKAGNVRRSDGGLDWNPTKQHILRSIEGSLKRLQTDYLDLYQLHGGTIQDNIGESIEAFELLKKQGKIRHYGISSIRPNVIREYTKRSSIVSVMMQYSLLDRRPEEECLELLHRNDISVLTRGSLAQGLLVNKPPKPYLDLSANDVENAVAAIRSISANKRSFSQTAIRYVLRHPAVTSAVVGLSSIEQLEDVVRTTDTPILTLNDLDLMKNSIPVINYREHRK